MSSEFYTRSRGLYEAAALSNTLHSCSGQGRMFHTPLRSSTQTQAHNIFKHASVKFFLWVSGAKEWPRQRAGDGCGCHDSDVCLKT